MDQEKFAKFLESADALTSLQTDFGSYAAIATVGEQDYLVEIDALNPLAEGYVKPVTREAADQMMATDYRTVCRR